MKSVKVFFLLSSRPSSYQRRPISCPPRMCAIAYDEAAIEQRHDARPRTSGSHRRAVGAVAVLQHRRRAVPLRSPCGRRATPAPSRRRAPAPRRARCGSSRDRSRRAPGRASSASLAGPRCRSRRSVTGVVSERVLVAHDVGCRSRRSARGWSRRPARPRRCRSPCRRPRAGSGSCAAPPERSSIARKSSNTSKPWMKASVAVRDDLAPVRAVALFADLGLASGGSSAPASWCG